MKRWKNEYSPDEFEFRTPNINLRKPLLGVGINDVPYVTEPMVGGKRIKCPFYVKWHNMLERCHSQKLHKKYPTYVGTTHCEEWTYFMNFRAWLLKELRKTDLTIGEAQIDKDILTGGKHYSPETCILIPGSLNRFLVVRTNDRGKLPLGVTRNGKRFRTLIHSGVGKQAHLGTFDTPEEAHQVWLREKIQMAKTMDLPNHLDNKKVRNCLIQRIKEMQ